MDLNINDAAEYDDSEREELLESMMLTAALRDVMRVQSAVGNLATAMEDIGGQEQLMLTMCEHAPHRR